MKSLLQIGVLELETPAISLIIYAIQTFMSQYISAKTKICFLYLALKTINSLQVETKLSDFEK